MQLARLFVPHESPTQAQKWTTASQVRGRKPPKPSVVLLHLPNIFSRHPGSKFHEQRDERFYARVRSSFHDISSRRVEG